MWKRVEEMERENVGLSLKVKLNEQAQIFRLQALRLAMKINNSISNKLQNNYNLSKPEISRRCRHNWSW